MAAVPMAMVEVITAAVSSKVEQVAHDIVAVGVAAAAGAPDECPFPFAAGQPTCHVGCSVTVHEIHSASGIDFDATTLGQPNVCHAKDDKWEPATGRSPP